MSTRTNHYQHCLENQQRIEQVMPTERWKAIKSVIYATLAVGFGTFSTLMDAEPTVVFTFGLFALLIFYGIEVREVEIAKWISVTFKHRRDD